MLTLELLTPLFEWKSLVHSRYISLCRILLAVAQILLLPDKKTSADSAGNDVTVGSDGNSWLDVFNILMNLGCMT